MKKEHKEMEGKRSKRDMKEDYKEETTKAMKKFKGPAESRNKMDKLGPSKRVR